MLWSCAFESVLIHNRNTTSLKLGSHKFYPEGDKNQRKQTRVLCFCILLHLESGACSTIRPGRMSACRLGAWNPTSVITHVWPRCSSNPGGRQGPPFLSGVIYCRLWAGGCPRWNGLGSSLEAQGKERSFEMCRHHPPTFTEILWFIARIKLYL